MGSPASGGPSVLGKRKAEVDEVSTSLTVERKIARKTTEKSRISSELLDLDMHWIMDLSRISMFIIIELSSSKVKLYDHLRPLEDNLELGLNSMFSFLSRKKDRQILCTMQLFSAVSSEIFFKLYFHPFMRLNSPGQQSAEIGHHYGNPNNHFWGCLHESGLTNRRLDPREDATLPRDFSIGLVRHYLHSFFDL